MDKLRVLLVCALLLAGITSSSAQATNTTTEEPITTAPTTDETTTTEDPTTTTTEMPTTTEPDTTPVPTTPPPSPSGGPFMVTEKNVTCIMVKADIKAAVSYKNGTAIGSVSFPSEMKKDTTVNGSCSEQYIIVSWGPSNASSSFTMIFNKTGEKEWKVQSLEADLVIDKKVSPDEEDFGKMLHLSMAIPMGDIGVDHSYNCISKVVMSNVSAAMEDEEFPYIVDVSMEKTQIEAYNDIENEKDFLDSVHCDADKTSDIVPIAVGCALAALVIIVLVAYLIGRRRRSAAYQSV